MSTFVARYKPEWDELEALVRRGRSWFKPLTAEERQRLDELYRRTAIHLARVSTRTQDEQLVAYLNNLTAAAHSVIYLPPNDSMLRQMGQFFTEGFARAIARHWREHLLSATLVIVGALVGYYTAMADVELAHALWPSIDDRQPGSSQEQLLEHLRYGREESGGQKFFFASFLFQHNLKVGVLALATGVLAAVPTVLLMLLNGMMLGVFAAIHHQAGINEEMWAWILPHGITELGAIMLCGGVGLMLGRAVVRPGAMTRDESLLAAGREAALICAGVAVMLLLAALIESYIRQSHWSTPARLTFAGATAFFWAAYIAYGFYRERKARAAGKVASDDAARQAAARLAAATAPAAKEVGTKSTHRNPLPKGEGDTTAGCAAVVVRID